MGRRQHPGGRAGVPGLDQSGKIVDGPDLSFESQSTGTRYLDGFGHGTHLAGIIAGRDQGFDPRQPQGGVFAGVAPDASLLNTKVATGDGGADVSQVIAALDWVVEHRNDAGMNVRVINLSYGTVSEQGWQVDPDTGTALLGEVDALGATWRPQTWVSAQDAGRTWVGGAWNGRTWTGMTWDMAQFQGVVWTGSSWSSVPWESHTWSVDRFQARGWRGDSWKARSWRGDS